MHACYIKIQKDLYIHFNKKTIFVFCIGQVFWVQLDCKFSQTNFINFKFIQPIAKTRGQNKAVLIKISVSGYALSAF